jgi:uncharacterized protein
MKAIYFLCCLVWLAGPTWAQVPPRPDPLRLYNNLSKEFPDFLSADEAATMEQKLVNFSNETSNQICIVISDDLAGMDASSYAFAIGNQWGVGTQKFNNGIVILIKPTEADGGRDLFIAPGYGLEGAIPDLMTKRVRELMTPYLQRGEFYTALDEGTTMLMQLAKGEYHEKQKKKKERSIPSSLIIIIVILFLVFGRLFRGRGYTYSRGGRNIFWGGGGFGGGFGGGGSFGGGSGGGFGGFGGGGFGGGGSGGKW